MNEVVYDSNFLVGFIDEDDTWHKIAVEINNEVKKKNLKTNRSLIIGMYFILD